MRALAFALRDYLASLKTNGTTAPYRNRMLDFEALNGLLGTADFRERGQRYDAGDAA